MKRYIPISLLSLFTVSLSVFSGDLVHLNEAKPFEAKQKVFYQFSIHSKYEDCNSLNINGFMFGHSHGLPTSPTISPMSEIKCLIEGVYFNMPGQWKINITDGNDHVSSFLFKVN